MQDKQKEFKEKLKNNYPDMRVLFVDKPSRTIWAKEKSISDVTPEEFEQFNLIKPLPHEVILDIEEKNSLEQIKKDLDAKHWNYEVWDSGSRGIHINIRFKNLAQLDLLTRVRIRKYIIDSVGADEKLAKESQWIACPYAPHFKTGKTKELLEIVTNSLEENQIDSSIIEYCQYDVEHLKETMAIQPDEEFIEFAKKDPYVQYCLENTISDGGRDFILFKNLAIGLVRSGEKREEIEKLALAITNNCPGKTVGEFMGWVDKALKGELTYYNKHELVQWSLQYGHPPLYQLEEKLDEMLTIKQLWDTIWKYNIACQPTWKDLCFYNMLGTVVDEREDDLRTHVIFQCDSTSGKDEGINLVEKTLINLGYVTSRPSEITDKTLIGGVNQTAVEQNTKHGVDKDNQENGKYVYRDEIEYGILGTAHWVAFSEAEGVFNPGAYNKKIQLILRQAMDKNRKIEKGVAGRMIHLNTNTSFILTTFTMSDRVYMIIENGLFQRCLFFTKELSTEDHEEILKHINTKEFNTNIRLNFDEVSYQKFLEEKLKVMKVWYNEHRKSFTYFKGCDEYSNHLWQVYMKKYNSLPPSDRNVMNSILRRAARNLKKIAILRAIWNMRTHVIQEDIDKSFDLLEKCVESVKDLILKQKPNKKREYSILMILRKGSMSMGDLHTAIKEQLLIGSPNLRTKEIKKLEDMNLVERFKTGKYDMMSLTEAGRQLVNED